MQRTTTWVKTIFRSSRRCTAAVIGGGGRSGSGGTSGGTMTTTPAMATTKTTAFGTTTTTPHRLLSTTTTTPPSSPSRFAVITHGQQYEMAMTGLHGKQLELAKLEGYGKDDVPFDPFTMDEEIDTFLDQVIAKANANTTNHTETSGDDTAMTTTAAAVPPEDVTLEDLNKDDDAFEVVEQPNEQKSEEHDSTTTTMSAMYNNDGSVRRKPSQVATLRAGYPSGGWFAVVQLAGSQYKVTTDDVLIVNLLQPTSTYKVGSIHTLMDQDVLLVGSTHTTILGMPYISGAQVDVLIEEITQDAKVIVFHKRRRKHSKRKNGFRRHVTMLRILDIRPPQSVLNSSSTTGTPQPQRHLPRIDPHNVEMTIRMGEEAVEEEVA
jgi:large subunit ribosomal protein L21